ncbi:MAG TPA: YfiR family protein [Stellaceae bacterium]|nr:YfiR family protein [Stellaceae bacterium]
MRLGALALAIAAATSAAAALEATEPAIKAAYLYKFGFFVEWPQAAFTADNSPINLCIVGNDPFGSLLDDMVNGQKIGARPVVVRRMSTIAAKSGCHIVYMSNDQNAQASAALASLRGSDVLTVTDRTADSGNNVGIINFVMKDNKVRFDIDDDAAASGGLTISSRLLNLALDVKPRH